MRCAQCHFENADGARFCRQCGTALTVAADQDAQPEANLSPDQRASTTTAPAGSSDADTAADRPATPDEARTTPACVQCGTVRLSDRRFCRICGFDFDAHAASSPAQGDPQAMGATAPPDRAAAHPAHPAHPTHRISAKLVATMGGMVVLVIAGAATVLTHRFEQAQQTQQTRQTAADDDAATAPPASFKSPRVTPQPGETMQKSWSGTSSTSRAGVEPTHRPPANRVPTHRPAPADNGDAQIATIRAVVENSLADGTACYEARQFDCAVTNADAALRLDPYNARALSLRAQATAARQAALNHLPIE